MSTEYLKKLGKRIVKARKTIPLIQKKFAETLGIAESTLNKYETGKRSPDAETLQAITLKTGVNPSWLLMGVGDMLGETETFSGQAYMELKKIVTRMMDSDDPEADRLIKLMIRWNERNPESDGGGHEKKSAG